MVCARTATNLIEPKMWPLLWMEWQEILHEVGHPHLVRTIRGWPGSASGTERSHAIHGSTDGTEHFRFNVLLCFSTKPCVCGRCVCMFVVGVCVCVFGCVC